MINSYKNHEADKVLELVFWWVPKTINSILHNDQKQLLLEPRGTDFADKNQRIRGTTQKVRACNFWHYFALQSFALDTYWIIHKF